MKTEGYQAPPVSVLKDSEGLYKIVKETLQSENNKTKETYILRHTYGGIWRSCDEITSNFFRLIWILLFKTQNFCRQLFPFYLITKAGTKSHTDKLITFSAIKSYFKFTLLVRIILVYYLVPVHYNSNWSPL